jgi:hypothetical protein
MALEFNPETAHTEACITLNRVQRTNFRNRF